MTVSMKTAVRIRNPFGFWFLGLCNNFVYSIMLSAAEDILNQDHAKTNASSISLDHCEETITKRHCDAMSTGAILLADILPTFIVKLTFPFFAHRLPYGLQHFAVIVLQVASLLTVAFSTRIEMSFLGVILTSCGSGIGEITYLALSSHFPGSAIAAFSAGTGMAGIAAALAYAAFTEPHLAHFSPRTTLLIVLVMPVLFAVVYWFLMQMPKTVVRVRILQPRTFIIRIKKTPVIVEKLSEIHLEPPTIPIGEHLSCGMKFRLIVPLLRFMIPLFVVYYGEYLINQGIVQSFVFPCASGFQLSPASQYRWFQVTYQLGVLISRTSILVLQLPSALLPLFALLQLCNASFALTEAIFSYVPHIGIIFAVILYEGLLGGLTYANAFQAMHATIPVKHREYSLAVATLADAGGIVAAAFSAIPVHNFICRQPIH